MSTSLDSQTLKPPHARFRALDLLRSRYFFTLAAVVFFVLWIFVRGATARQETSTNELQDRLQIATSANNLLQQQLDEMFGLATAFANEQADMSAKKLALFDSWLKFDEHFLNRIRREPASKFVQSNVHTRRGLIHNLLDQHEQATREFENAIKLLEELCGQHPAILGYKIDLLRAHIYAARSAEKIDLPPSQILHHIDSALDLLHRREMSGAKGFEQLEQGLVEDSAAIRKAAES